MRTSRLATAVVSLGVAVLAVVIAVRGFASLGDGRARDARPIAGSTPEERSTTPQIFVPPTHSEGSRTVLPLTFPDGSSAEIVYSSDMRLAERGVRPYFVACGRDLNFFYGYDPDEGWYSDEELGTYEGFDGARVRFLRAADNPNTGYFVFHFGDWTVLMYDYLKPGLSEEQRRRCVADLRGSQTPGGFLVLKGDLPDDLALGDPELMIGDLRPGILLFPGPCQNLGSGQAESIGRRTTFASWCLSNEMTIHAYDDPDGEFIERARNDLHVRRVTLA